MKIEALCKKMIDTMGLEQVMERLKKWNARLQVAASEGDTETVLVCGRVLSLYDARYEHLQKASDL